MKVRIELEGTPEEIESSAFLRSLAADGLVIREITSTTPGQRDASAMLGVGAELDRRGIAGRVRDLVEAFVAEVVQWEDVEPPEWGTPGPTPKADYIRLRRRPPSSRARGRPPGAFVYVFPARAAVRFRLNAADAEGAQYAKRRGVQAKDPYQIQVPLHHKGMVEEAIRLARKAYEQVEEEVTRRAAQAS